MSDMSEEKPGFLGKKRDAQGWKPPEFRRGGRRKLVWAAAAVVLLLVVAFAAGILGNRGTKAPEAPVEEGPPPVVSASGAVVPAKRARLSFTTSGRIRRIAVQPGDDVRQGQLLALLEPSTVQSSMYGGPAGPGTPDLYLVAPFDGTVGLVPVREWETVAPGEPVVMLGDLTSLRVEIEDLSESDVGRLQVGQSVDVSFESFPGRKVSGQVARISPMNNAKGGGVNYDVVVEFTDQDIPPLRWGMTAHADILVGDVR